jgi:hypothetical protein
LESNIELKFTPSLKDTAYNISIASDTVLTLSLLPGKKWANPTTVDGMTLYLTELRFHGGNLREGSGRVAGFTMFPFCMFYFFKLSNHVKSRLTL